MLAVSTSDQASLARVLALAFESDPLLRWVIPNDQDYGRFAERFFRLQLKNSIQLGSSFTNQDRTGVALWFGPDDRHSFLTRALDSLRTVWLLQSNLGRAYRVDEIMTRYRPRRDYLHLTHLATAPEAQGSGVARQLLEPTLRRARLQGTPVYLECSNKANLGFYRQFGFRLIDDIPVTTQGQAGPTIWPMTLEH
ncbi:MAG: GNAT family N-acetyltransferase [Pseudomonadales bacterium]